MQGCDGKNRGSEGDSVPPINNSRERREIIVFLAGFWRREIEEALGRAHFGLLLLSPRFLASDFITAAELPKLLEKRMLVPVALHAVPLDGSSDLKGLRDRQIFRDAKGRAFDKCRTPSDRRDFARELFGTIDRLLEKYA